MPMLFHQAHESLATIAGRFEALHEACVFEHVEMVGEQCRTQLEFLDEFTRCAVRRRKLFGDLQPPRISECREHFGALGNAVARRRATLDDHGHRLYLSRNIERYPR